jgi:hypothetical protein
MTNQLEKIEPHAKRLEDAADRMDAAGIGGHPVNGHVAVLRGMAASMRADAAVGKMPHAYIGTGSGAVFGAAGDAPKGRPILTLVQAAAAKKENAPLVQQICATAQRLGLSSIEPDTQIDINKLNADLTNRNVGIDARMSLKAMLHRLHTIA